MRSAVAALALASCVSSLALAQGMGSLQGVNTGATVGGNEAVCDGRATCRITRELDAGRDAEGQHLTVVEARFGIREGVTPDVSDEFPCRDDDGGTDGGSEWHLLADGQALRKLLTLCNDGYGASGVGEDTITVDPNQLTHRQMGGSAWRWAVTRLFQLSPPRLVSTDECSFHNIDATSGSRVLTDVGTAEVTVLGYRGGRPDSDDGFLGCPSPGDAGGNGVTVTRALAVPIPDMEGEMNPSSGIGTCGARISSDGTAGFVTFGAPAMRGKGAEVRAVALDGQTLVLQIRDPKADTGGQGAKSWVHQPHVELYLGATDGSEARPFAQIGITLDGKVQKGVGAAPPVKVRAWRNVDEQGREVTRLWLTFDSTEAMSSGLVVVYSEAEAGRQIRLTSTSIVEKLQPVSAPAPAPVPSICAMHGDLLDVVGAPDTLDGADR